MSYTARQAIYESIEQDRKTKVLSFVTGEMDPGGWTGIVT